MGCVHLFIGDETSRLPGNLLHCIKQESPSIQSTAFIYYIEHSINIFPDRNTLELFDTY